MLNNPSAIQQTHETWVWPLGHEDALEEEMTNPFQYSCLGNPMDKELGRLQSTGSQSQMRLNTLDTAKYISYTGLIQIDLTKSLFWCQCNCLAIIEQQQEMNILFILLMKTGTHNKKIQMACPFLTQSLICYIKMRTHFYVYKIKKKKKATSLFQLVKWSLQNVK